MISGRSTTKKDIGGVVELFFIQKKKK